MKPTRLSPWLARFSFSFFIVGGWLFWQCYKAVQGQLGPISNGQLILFLIGGLVSIVMGIVGIRERHRPYDDEP